MRASALFLTAVLLGAFAGCSGDTFSPGASGGGAGNAGQSGGGGNAGRPAGAAGATGGNAGAPDPGGASGASGSSSGNGGSAGAAGNAGAAGGASGNGASGMAGSGGAGGKADGGASGKAGGSGAAGNAGNSGAGGKGGAGSAGAPTTCEEASPSKQVSAFGPGCAPPFDTCVLPNKVGKNAQVAATTCGVAVAHMAGSMTIGVSFPERPDVLTLSLSGADSPHGIAMRGQQLLVGSSGDALLGVPSVGVGITAMPFLFAPPGGAALNDQLGYRSLVATSEVVAWTGRQGYEVTLLAPPSFACAKDRAAGECTEQRSFSPANAQSATPSPGWGITAIGKKVYWSTPIGIHAVTLGQTAFAPETLQLPNAQPGALTTARGHLLMGKGPALTVVGPDLGSAAGLPLAHGEIRDLIGYGDNIFIVTKGAGAGELAIDNTLTIAGSKVRMFILEMPSTTEPLSVAAGPNAAYVGTADGTVYRFPIQ